jgi:hypothetical protein
MEQAGFFNLISGTDVALSANNSADPITILFNTGNVTAVGGEFFTTDLAGNTSGGVITATLNDGTSLVFNTTTATTFGGFTSVTPIASLTLQTNVPLGFFVTTNNMVVGSVTPVAPEPGSLALLLLPVGAALFRAARRRSAAPRV